MIDELERVRAFRAAEPPPSEAATAAARSMLLKLIHERPTTEQPGAPSLLHGQADEGPRPRRYAWRGRVAIAVALTCAGIAIAGVLGSPTATSPASATAAALEQLARVAAAQPWSGIPGRGQYLYTRSVWLNLGTTEATHNRLCHFQYVVRRQSWIATNGAGELREATSHARFTSAKDRSTCRLAHISPAQLAQDTTVNQRFGRGGLSFPTNRWHTLSTNPARLLKQLRPLDGGPRTPREDFVHIGDFLRESDAPPAIRAALYRAAKLIPGVRLLGPTRDHAGRLGLGVAWFSHGRPDSELIFDRRTAALLGEGSFGRSGKLDQWTVYLQSKIVNRLPGAHRGHH